ncbi:ABC transporter permease [Saccharothrix sp. Mg75]|uniref:ABC transporter permease n=1 Tax=Saccharothrix sp. Mg75 TaxID=3445357 RepID=UPI003EEC968B
MTTARTTTETTGTADGSTAAPPPVDTAVVRSAVGWRDLLWLAWRRHRWTVGGAAVVVAVVAGTALALAAHVTATGHQRHELLGRVDYADLAYLLSLGPALFGAVVAVFWTAPLLSREYEQRTHLVVWSQDISPLRWLVGKVVLLGVPAVALAAGLGASLVVLMNAMNATNTDYVPFRAFDPMPFEVVPQVQAAYAAFGFALGLAMSALTRRTVLSMGLTLVAYGLTRALVAALWRPFYRTPERVLEPYSPGGLLYSSATGDDDWTVGSGYADAAGTVVDYPRHCVPTGEEVDPAFRKCVADTGLTQHYTDFQPADRVAELQWVEFAVFTVPAAALLALALVTTRRPHRV